MWREMIIVIKKLQLLCVQEEGMTKNRVWEGFLDHHGGAGSDSQTQMGITNKEPNRPPTYSHNRITYRAKITHYRVSFKSLLAQVGIQKVPA